jgi:PAS domain S-box-containing protein
MLAGIDPEHLLATALSALEKGIGCHAALDEIPVPVYTTDAEGKVTYWNRACIEFAGREPQLGQDRWCITWHLFTTSGDALAHEDCPMAEAIRQRQPIRDSIALAERPDGSRVAFRPYPTPLFDDEGNLTGAINVLIDITEEQSEALHEQAERCRRLADATYDRATSRVLDEMANGFDKAAGTLVSRRH